MRVGQDVLSDLGAALGMEWVVPYGTGGSSSGTACGANGRRSHALLAAAGPHGRLHTLLLKVDERLHGPGIALELGCSVFAGGVPRPAGHLLLESFALDPWPRWTWRVGGLALEKSLVPISGHDAVAIRYRLIEGPPLVTLAVSPLVVARDPSGIQRELPELHTGIGGVPGRVQLQLLPDRPALTLWHNGAFLPARVWQHGLCHPRDADPGDGEDAFVPGHIEASLSPGIELHVVAAAEADLFRALAREDRLGTPPPRTLAECVRILEHSERAQHSERERQATAAAAVTAAQATDARERAAQAAGAGTGAMAGGPDANGVDNGSGDGGDARSAGAGYGAEREPGLQGDPWTARLSGLVLSGLTRGGRGPTVVGSLPGATRRGADALRALPALLTLRAFDAARAVLATAAEHVDEGLAAEDFDLVDGTPRHGDPAPSLWFVHAAELYARRSGDIDFVRHTLYGPLEAVVQSYRAGTRGGVRAGTDGLLMAGEKGVRRADLNALWYHALVAMAQLAKKTERKEAAAFYLAWAREHQTRFNEAFWDEKRNTLYEAIDERGPVRGISPGQVLAARVAPPVLVPERIAPLVLALERALFTPLGLRSGPRATRLETAWLGTFYSAYLRAHARSAEAQARVREWLGVLHARLGLGLPEWFEPETDDNEGRATRGAGRGGRSANEPAPEIDFATVPSGGDALSVLAAAELLPVWIEELDHATATAAAVAG